MAPVIADDADLISKESIGEAKAETATVEDGVASLGVTIKINADITAETKDWRSDELRQENVKVEIGRIAITIPAELKSGFMILQSGDAKKGLDN